MIALIYIVAIIASIFYAGVFAPIIGLGVGFFIHMIILLTRISKSLNEISSKLDKNESIKSEELE